MYEYLGPGTVRRTLTDSNLALINTDPDQFTEAARAVSNPAVIPLVTDVQTVDLRLSTALSAEPPTATAVGMNANERASQAELARGDLPAGAGDEGRIGPVGRDLLVGGVGPARSLGLDVRPADWVALDADQDADSV